MGNNWAVVIGIDRYTRWAQGALHGAVRDALAARTWLLDRAGGQVDPKQLYTLLSPHPASNTGLVANEFKNPTKERVEDLINEINQRVNAGADNFYFYFSGHGLSRLGGPVGHDDAIAFSDFSPKHPDRSLHTEHIFARLQLSSFEQEYFFIDACRDTPWKGATPNFGKFADDPEIDVGKPIPGQVRMFATTPGSRANEVGTSGNERGAFTSALLAGLRGDGSAKHYESGPGEYYVLASSLFRYVREVVKAQKLAAGSAAGSIQVPETIPYPGSQPSFDPIIVNLGRHGIPPVDLVVTVDPKQSPPPPPARIRVIREEKVVANEEWAQQPVRFKLPQRDYGIETDSDVYVQDPEKVVVLLYSPSEQVLKWRRRQGPPPPATPPQPPASGGPPQSPRRRATLTVKSFDQMAPVEIVAGRNRVAHGLGTLITGGLKPGFYRARLRIPDRKPVERAIYLNAGEDAEIAMPAPRLKGPVVEQLFPKGLAWEQEDNAIHVSETIGGLAAPSMGTVLGLGALLGDFPETFEGGGYHLNELKLGDPPALQNLDVLVSLSGELVAPESVSARVLDLDDMALETSFALQSIALPSTARGNLELKTGMHWLSLDLPQRSRLVIPIAIFEKEVSRLVVEVPHEGPATIVMYQSRAGLDKDRLRLIDRFERAVIAGEFDSALLLAKSLHDLPWNDPIGRAIEASVRLRVRQLGQARSIAQGLAKSWPQLSDGWALLGAVGEMPADEAATRSLDAGIPVVSDTARALNSIVRQSKVDHHRRDLLARVVAGVYPGSFWTAWPG